MCVRACVCVLNTAAAYKCDREGEGFFVALSLIARLQHIGFKSGKEKNPSRLNCK